MTTRSSKPGSTKRLRTLKQHVTGYDDLNYDSHTFWQGREYEHAAEGLAIRRLLDGIHVKRAVDIGGGHGRLSRLLREYADHVVLAEPSEQQLSRARTYLKHISGIEFARMQADDLQFADGSIDLALMVRVLSHIAYPAAEFAEIARVLKDDGVAIVEVANHMHVVTRLKYMLRNKHLPTKALALTPSGVIRTTEFQLMSHNPHTVARQLAHAGLRIERVLSVSNLRSQHLKRYLSPGTLIFLERLLQVPLASFYFGPSIFFLVKKARP